LHRELEEDEYGRKRRGGGEEESGTYVIRYDIDD
jgi:hypothetical protein